MGTTGLTCLNAILEAETEEMARDPRAILLGEDIAVFRVPMWHDGHWSRRTERVFGPGEFVTSNIDETKDPGMENLRARLPLSEMPTGREGSWEAGLCGDNPTDRDDVGYGIGFGGLSPPATADAMKIFEAPKAG